jgi:PPP family 3-phenylpropionic acid transporter
MIFGYLSIFYFFYFSSVGVYVIFLPKVLHDLGYLPVQIGIIFALAPLMRFLTPFMFMKKLSLTNKIFKYSLIGSFLCSLMFYITIYNFYLFLIINALIGISLSLILPFIENIAVTHLGKDKYGKSRLFGSIGFMLVAIILGNNLTDSFTALHFYLGSTLLTAITGIILSNYEKNSNETDSNEVFSFSNYWLFWISLFLMQVSFGGFYNFFTIYETEHGISLEMTSYLWAFGVICEIVMLYFQAPILKKNLVMIIKFSIIITIFRWLLVFIFPQNLFIAFLAQSFHAFSFGLYYSAVIVYLYSIYANKKLAGQFMFGFAYGLGGFVGAISAGWFYGKYLFLYSAIIALLAFLAQHFQSKKDKLPSLI